jgi:hypothetical protein
LPRELDTLEDLSKRIVISDPPLVHSAIGKVVPDPCHPGKYLINEAVRVTAIRERRSYPSPPAASEEPTSAHPNA